MELTGDLLKRFFRKECTAAEADFVAQYLRENPGAMDVYFNQQEFNETEAIDTNSNGELEQWDALQHRLKVHRIRKNIQRLAIAAGLVGIVTMFAFLFNTKSENRQLVKNNETALKADSSNWTEIANRTAKTELHTLKDGSTIKLSAGALIRFNQEQWQTRRDIELKGEAVFYVAKDKTRPFTVYCNQVSVRALGTIFAVRQQHGADSMRVRLFEGKVLVRKQHEPRGKDSVDLVKPVTLKPGQEMLFAENRDIAYVRPFLNTTPAPVGIAKNTHVGPAPKTTSPGWVEFNNQPLSDLFVSLEVLYNVEIGFKPEDVQDIYFMGRFESYDKIDGILEIIGRLNGLTVEKTAANTYEIRKSK